MGILSGQVLNLSTPEIEPQGQLMLTQHVGTAYRSEYETWSLVEDGGYFRLKLDMNEAVPVQLTLNLCAIKVGDITNCPLSITVNRRVFVREYCPHNIHFKPLEWIIPAMLLNSGDNEIKVTLEHTASTQLFINQISVRQAELTEQVLDLSVPCPENTTHLVFEAHNGAMHRNDVETWSLCKNDDGMHFVLSIPEPQPVRFIPEICAELVHGRADCPISITVNGKRWKTRYKDEDPHFHLKHWEIPDNLLKAGDNDIRLILDNEAETQLFIRRIIVSGD